MATMRTRTEVRNNKNLIIGWCDDFGSEITAFHMRKGFVGRYVKSSNLTLTSKGSVYCYGDGTQSLIRDADNN